MEVTEVVTMVISSIIVIINAIIAIYGYVTGRKVKKIECSLAEVIPRISEAKAKEAPYVLCPACNSKIYVEDFSKMEVIYPNEDQKK